MRLDHLLAADALGTAPEEAQRARAEAVLGAFGFLRTPTGFALDDTFPWVTVDDAGVGFHVTVQTPLPGHLVHQVLAALEGLVTEAGLVRIDLLTRGQIDPSDWSRRVAATRADALQKGFP